MEILGPILAIGLLAPIIAILTAVAILVCAFVYNYVKETW